MVTADSEQSRGSDKTICAVAGDTIRALRWGTFGKASGLARHVRFLLIRVCVNSDNHRPAAISFSGVREFRNFRTVQYRSDGQVAVAPLL